MKPVKKGNKKAKSLSIIRSFMRYAVSSIVYHRILPATKTKKPRLTDEGTNHNHVCNNSNDSNEHDLEQSKMREHSFAEMSFCGLENLKYMDALDENDMVKDKNVFRMTKWLEEGVFPLLEQDILNTLYFAILSTPIQAASSSSSSSSSTASDSSDVTPNNDNSKLELFEFKFAQYEAEETKNERQQGTIKISTQIHNALKTIIELCSTRNFNTFTKDIVGTDKHNKMSHKRQPNYNHNRVQVSMNFILKCKESSEKTPSSIFADGQQRSNPLDEIVPVPISNTKPKNKKNDINESKNAFYDSADEDDENSNGIVEFDEDDGGIDLKEDATQKNMHVLAQQSQVEHNDGCYPHDVGNTTSSLLDVDGHMESKADEALSFQHVDKIQSSHHGVDVNYRQFQVDELNSNESLRKLFGEIISVFRQNEVKVRTEKDHTNTSRIRKQNEVKKNYKAFDRTEDDCSIPDRRYNIRQTPFTLTPYRSPPKAFQSMLSPRRVVKGNKFSENETNKKAVPRKRKMFDNNLTLSTINTNKKFITPTRPSNQKSPSFSRSSEAPTLVMRLSSCNTNQDLSSSITPTRSSLRHDTFGFHS